MENKSFTPPWGKIDLRKSARPPMREFLLKQKEALEKVKRMTHEEILKINAELRRLDKKKPLK